MDGADLRGRERMLISQAEVIVMRADHYIFVGGARQVGGDIMNGFGLEAYVDRKIDGELRESKGVRMAVLIDLLRDGAQVVAFGFHPAFGGVELDANEQDAGVGRTF